MTGYVELYKKYRPAKWSELIGQEKTAKSLQSAVINDMLPTSYGFFGPRGTGKTSAALLLAKSINCLDRRKNGDPCNECEICENIDNGTQLGINYISAANNGSVEEIRSIVKTARLNQPVKKQVFIIDEVHTIHRQAFDALLIPLEEKNMPALFIFCSTEINKIPDTVKSRIQQRRFSLVGSELMLEHLKKVAEKENLDVDDTVLNLAVRMGKGSVRDTMTALDGLLTNQDDYSESYGTKLLEAAAEQNIPEIMKILAEANNDSVNFRDLAEQFFEDLRDLLLLDNRVSKDLVGVVPVKNVKKVLLGLQRSKGIITLMNSIGEAITQMSQGNDSRIMFEMSLIKGVLMLNKIKKIAGMSES